MSKDTARVLRGAAEVLETDGWCQGDLHQMQPDGTFSHCAVGAIYKAAGETGHLCGMAAHEALIRRVGVVSAWNDDPDRRMPDVVKLFGQVADEEEFREW